MSVVGPTAPGSEDPLLGRVLSERYRILKKLGEGGMGAVYLAEHVVIEKKLALKVLFPDLTRRADLIQRFLQEAKSASRIGHENVIDITDFGQSPEGYVFIAMEYLSGQDLAQVLKASGPMPWARVQPIVLQIAKALRAAHERGIIHRDMKPENIFILPRDDGREFVKVLDFGIAKVMGLDEDVPRLTRTGMIFGTPEYMSPEQAQGRPVDHRVDIYAVGCILFHMLTGRVPFKADSFMGILSKQMVEAPPSPRALNPSIEPEVEAVILKAMEKDPSTRFQTMRELLQALAPSRTSELGGVAAAPAGASRSALYSGPAVTGPAASGSVPAVASGAVPVVVPGAPASFPYATHEVEGRAGVPLAAANPEVRRSRTEAFGRAERPLDDRPPWVRPRAGNGGLVALAAAAIAVMVSGFVLLRHRATTSAEAAPPAVRPGPVPVAAPAPPPPAVAPAPAPPPAAAPVEAPTAAPAAAVKLRGAEKKSTHKRRSSREAVESLGVSAGGEAATPPPTPATRTPAELKNPFAR